MRFSVVTPTYNSERFLAETIESVISQKGDFEIQYIIADNCSSDRTLEIAQRYQWLLEQGSFRASCRKFSLEILSEKDSGMYDAINKGFKHSDGEIMAWINSDDVYLPGALNSVSRALSSAPQVQWLKGITSYMNEHSEVVRAGQCYLYDQRWIEAGYCGPLFPFIQQDSVFWRRPLWERVGGCDGTVKMAGDYLLWRSFARHEPLYSFARYLSYFRSSPAQLSVHIDRYWKDAEQKQRLPKPRHLRLLDNYLKGGLPRRVKIAIRRQLLGPERFCALVEAEGRWIYLDKTAMDRTHSILDRAIDAVLV